MVYTEMFATLHKESLIWASLSSSNDWKVTKLFSVSFIQEQTNYRTGSDYKIDLIFNNNFNFCQPVHMTWFRKKLRPLFNFSWKHWDLSPCFFVIKFQANCLHYILTHNNLLYQRTILSYVLFGKFSSIFNCKCFTIPPKYFIT